MDDKKSQTRDRADRWAGVRPLFFSPTFYLGLLFLVVTTINAFRLPSFEGPDESEHCRYIQACREGVTLHPATPEIIYRWGYQIHHPPLYYELAGLLARVIPGLPSPIPRGLIANAAQNPHYPFIRHDLPGHRFPYAPAQKALRFFRLLSVGFGLLTFWLVARFATLLFPNSPRSRFLLLTCSLFAPNTIQIFSTVANDGLAMLLTCAALTAALQAASQKPETSDRVPRWMLLTGLALGLGLITKLTTLITLAVVGSFWPIIAWRWPAFRMPFRRGLPGAIIALLLFAAPYFLYNSMVYRDPLRTCVLRQFTGGHLRPAPLGVWPILREGIFRVLPRQVLADLGWETIRFPRVSVPVFWLWLISFLVGTLLFFHRPPWTSNPDIPTQPAVSPPSALHNGMLLAGLSLFWSLLFLIYVNRTWMNLQIRHIWALAPCFFIPVVFFFRFYGRVFSPVLRTLAVVAVLTALLTIQLRLPYSAFFFRPCPVSGADRNYRTFILAYQQNRSRAESYLTYNTFAVYDRQHMVHPPPKATSP